VPYKFTFDIIMHLGELALSYLRRPWYAADGQPEKGSAHNEQLQALLQYVFYQLI